MSAVGYRRMVERLGETPKMAFPSHPHMLRHSTYLAYGSSPPPAWPWNAIQRYRRDARVGEVPLHEMVCAENNDDHFDQGLFPIPQADKPDF